MPRGFKRDEVETLRSELKDKRSFVSQPKFAIEDHGPHHFILYGEDKRVWRSQIFARDRIANGGKNLCWKCHRRVYEFVEQLMFSHDQVGEWDHIRNKAGERCDCIENGRVACHACHKQRHVQVRFGEDR